MAKKITRTSTIGEAAKQVGTNAATITKACKELGIDIVNRSPKHLTSAEVTQIGKYLAKDGE